MPLVLFELFSLLLLETALLLRFLLGSPVKLTVLVPGDSVDAVEISEVRLEAAHEAV